MSKDLVHRELKKIEMYSKFDQIGQSIGGEKLRKFVFLERRLQEKYIE